jgi:hypothetical protein
MRAPLSAEIVIEHPISVGALDPAVKGTPPAAGDPDRIALLVCHGMGQQVRFQTLMDVARSLLGASGVHSRGWIGVRQVRIGEKEHAQTLQRAEITLEDKDRRRRDVHLYEAYWAPLTAGRVSIRDVISFLATAAYNGWDNASGPTFRRWLFGRPIELRISKTSTRWRLAWALAVVLGLVVINAAIGLVGASRIAGGAHDGWPCGPVLALLAKELLAVVLLMLLVWLSISLAQKRRKRKADAARLAEHRPRGSVAWTWACIWAAIAGTALTALAIVVELVWSVLCVEPGLPIDWWWLIGMVLLWAMMFALSAGVRFFLIEYVGDVAAYISSHTASKFNDVREAIRELSFGVGKAVYTALHEGGRSFEYGHVIVVGHSLGSVVAYDTLNAVIREDRAAATPFDAVNRTRMLLTFGSPLNKTAFIFRTQMPEASELREALAASMQPMIQHYDLRPAEWVNIFSRADWIGGPIEYYDDPDDDDPEHVAKKIKNVEDPAATTPLVAHNELWTSPTLAERLVGAIFG